MSKAPGGDRADAPADAAGVRVRWDDSAMRSNYANVCQVAGTREEIALLFGVNQTWTAAAKELVVQVLDKVIISPYAAKRLHLLLGRVIQEYETRYGPLPVEAGPQPRPAEPLPTGG
jgi:hypothetical protein